MNIELYDVLKFKVAVVDNFYNDKEYQSMLDECLFLCENNKLLPPEKTGTAYTNDEVLKKNKGLFLDDVYINDRNISNILTFNRKVFSKELVDTLVNIDPIYRYLAMCARDNTLLSYYENSDYYKPHTDYSKITILHWIYKTPKKFTGGDLKLNDSEHSIECVSNRLLVFPSFLTHEVTPIIMEKKFLNKKNGRFTITVFCH